MGRTVLQDVVLAALMAAEAARKGEPVFADDRRLTLSQWGPSLPPWYASCIAYAMPGYDIHPFSGSIY